MICNQNHECRSKTYSLNLTESWKPNHMMANLNKTPAKKTQHQEIIKKTKLAEIELPSGPKVPSTNFTNPPAQVRRTTSDPTREDRRQLSIKIFFCCCKNVCNLTRIFHTDQIAFSLKT